MIDGFFGLMTCPISYDWAALLIRLAVGIALIPYGIMKFAKRKENAAHFPKVWIFSSGFAYYSAMLIEFFVPVCLILGFCTRLAVIPAIVSMSFAVKVNHTSYWTAPASVYLLMMIAILFIGAGNYSLDYLLMIAK